MLDVDIKDSLWTDPRIFHLAKMLKLRPSSAVGEVAAVWRIAQNRDTDTFGLTDLDVLTGLKGLTEKMAACDLIEIKENRARLKGVAERLEKIRSIRVSKSNNAKKRWNKERSKDANDMQMHCNRNADEMQNDTLILDRKLDLKLKLMDPSDPMEERIRQQSRRALSPDDSADDFLNGNAQILNEPEFVESEIVQPTPKKQTRKNKAIEFSKHDLDLAERWFSWTTSLAPHIKATPTSFAAAIFETKRALARSMPTGDVDALIDAVFDFIRDDKFWSKNCLSPGGLLKKGNNDLRKIDNIITAMRGYEFHSKRNSLNLEKIEPMDMSWMKL